MRLALLCFLLATAVPAQEAEDPIAFTISGSLHGTNGEPLAGVAVRAWDDLAAERYLGEAITGSNGRFLVPLRRSAVARREHPFGPVAISVRAPGIALLRQSVDAGARDVKLVAPPARTITGVVLRDGKGVPAAIVRGVGPAGEERTTADEEGRFRLTQFAPSESVKIVAFRDDAGLAATGVARGGGEATLTLPAAKPVAARMVDAASGDPVAGARLFIAGMRVVAVTDEDGRVAVDGVRDIHVHASGYRIASFAAGDVKLERAAPMRGRVVDHAGKPVEGCPVTLEADGGVRLARRTDEFGKYEFDVVPAGLVRITAARRGGLPASLRIVADDEVTLRLLRGALVAGRALRDGEPAMGARVSALDEAGGEVAFAYADAEGRYLLPGVPLSARRLVARLGGEAAASVELPELAEAERAGPFTLALKDHLGLGGTLHSDAGLPLAGVEISCLGQSAKTDGAGRFLFDRLPVGDVELALEPPRHFPMRVAARPGVPVAIVAVSRLGDGKLSLTVQGARVFEYSIRRLEEPRVRRAGRSEAGNRPIRFIGLAAGSYDVNVVAAGFLPVSYRIEVADREGIDIDVELRRGGTLKLEATPGASVAILAVRGKAPPVVGIKLTSGEATLRDFGPGLYRFISRAPGELIVVRELELSPTTPPARLDLRGGKEALLMVVVQDATGAPLKGASITLATEGGFERRYPQKTDATGKVLIDRLFEGRMSVRAALGNRLGAEALEIAPGQEQKITVVVR